MVRAILILLLGALTAGAADVITFQPDSTPVPNRYPRLLRSQDTLLWLGATNAFVITNAAAQRGPGVTESNLTQWCVVDGSYVRLLNTNELATIAATNALLQAAAVAQAKLDAIDYAKTVANRTDGDALFWRAVTEVMLGLVNTNRVADGLPVVSKSAFKTLIEAKIEQLGE